MHKGRFTAIIAVIGLQYLKDYIKKQMRECLLKCCDLISQSEVIHPGNDNTSKLKGRSLLFNVNHTNSSNMTAK